MAKEAGKKSAGPKSPARSKKPAAKSAPIKDLAADKRGKDVTGGYSGKYKEGYAEGYKGPKEGYKEGYKPGEYKGEGYKGY